MAKINHQSFQSLEEARNFYLRSVDRYAGQVRSQFITTEPGQAEVYNMKNQQAAQYLQNPGLSENFPWVVSEALARSGEDTPEAMSEAALWITANADTWSYGGAKIEQHRMSAKYKIREKTTAREMWIEYNEAINNMESVVQEMLNLL